MHNREHDIYSHAPLGKRHPSRGKNRRRSIFSRCVRSYSSYKRRGGARVGGVELCKWFQCVEFITWTN